jgi:hypothetical protein
MSTDPSQTLADALARHVEPSLAERGWEQMRVDQDPPLVMYANDAAFLAFRLTPGSDPSVRYLQLLTGPVELAFEPSTGVDHRDVEQYRHPGIGRLELNRRVGLGRFPANDPAEIDASVARLAEWLREAPQDVLLGDPDILRAIDADRRARVDARHQAWNLEDLRSDAATAWADGDWQRAAELLSRIPAVERKPSEDKRLDIAARRAAESR